MLLTLSEASNLAKVSKTTLWRAIKSGKISASRDDDGSYRVDAAELSRVYSAIAESLADETMDRSLKQQVKRPETDDETGETADGMPQVSLNEPAIQELLALKDQLIQRQDDIIADLRLRLNQSEEERRQATKTLHLLLTHDSQEKNKPRGSGLAFLGALIFLVIAITVTIFIVQLR